MRSNSYIQWYNENGGRAYPLAEQSTQVSNAGRSLPDDILVDFGLMVPPGYTDVYLSSIKVTPTLITLGISSPTSGLFVGTYAASAVEPYTAYPLTGLVDNVSGWVVFGNHNTVVSDDYRFASATQSGIEARALRVVDVLPVSKLLRLGGNPTQLVEQLVQLVGGQGVVVEIDSVDDQKIIVKLDPDMEHLFVGPCNEVSRTEVCGVPPMTSLNGVCPDATGKITIRFE